MKPGDWKKIKPGDEKKYKTGKEKRIKANIVKRLRAEYLTNIGKNMKDNQRLTIKYPVTVLFFLICFLAFIGYIVLPQKDFSEKENRFLKMRPKVTASSLLDGKFMEDFETYTNEQVPLRDMLVNLKACIVRASGACENDGIAAGAEGYLFDTVLSENARVHTNISTIADFAKRSERDVYICIAPTSTAINERLLPKGMPVLDERALQTELENKAEAVKSAHVINLFDKFTEHAGENIYYRTDHHWTTEGAGLAYESIAEAMGLETKDIKAYEKHEAGGFYGTHYAKYKGGFVKPDTIEYYDVGIDELDLPDRKVNGLFDETKLDTYDKYAGFMYGNYGKSVVFAQKNAARDLIIFKDSYANCLIPYLVMNYDKVTVIDLRYYNGNVNDELDDDPDSDVLLLYNWTFVNDDNHFYKLESK